MASLMHSLEEVTGTLDDVALRHQVERVFAGLNEIDTEVLPVGQARSTLRPLRERLHGGSAALIADRGVVRDAEDTTVMLSLETLQNLVVSIIEKTADSRDELRSPSEMLVGLVPVLGAEAHEVDFDAAAVGEPDQADSALDFSVSGAVGEGSDAASPDASDTTGAYSAEAKKTLAADNLVQAKRDELD